MPTATTRSILVKTREGEKIIEGVPSGAKITFGPVQPGSKEYGGDRTNCLRIYTTANNQLAVFVGVTEFRDLDLTVKTRRIKEKQKRSAEHGPNGSSVETATEETYTWEKEE